MKKSAEYFPGRVSWQGILGISLLLAVCSHSARGAAASPSIIIPVWTRSAFNDEGSAIIAEAAVAFNQAQHNYRVELYSSNYKNYADWINGVAVTGTLPCLLEIDGPFVAAFAWPGYLRALDEFISRDMRHDLLPSIITQGTYDGHLYSLGQFESGLGLWANRRYLAVAHVRLPTVMHPWTLAEFEHAMERLARLDGVKYPLNMAFYTGTSEFYTYAYAPLLQGFGGDLIDRSNYRSARGVLDGPQSVAAMHRLQYWLNKGWTRPILDHNDDFERARTALAWSGHWKYGDYHKALGNDLVLLPLPDFGHGIKTGMGSWSWGISSTCPDPAGAWAFLAYLMSPREILRMTNTNGALPARKSAILQSRLYGDRGPLQVFAQQFAIGAGVPRPATPAYGTITKAFSAAITTIIAGGDAQTALSRAATVIDQDIDEGHGYPP